MNNVKKQVSILYNPWLVLIALVDFLFLEFSCEKVVDTWNKGIISWPYHQVYQNLFFVLCLIFLLSVVGVGWSKHKYRLTSSTLRQLISNALGYKWLTLFILFFFMMHFSWSIDAGFDIFVKAEWNIGNIFHVIIPSSGMFVAALFIPIKHDVKTSLCEAEILLSAISVYKDKNGNFMLLPRNLDLFFKPFFKGISIADSDNSSVQLKGIEKVIIIPSRSLLECKISNENNNEWIELINRITIPQKVMPDEDKLQDAIDQYNKLSTFDNMARFLSCFIDVDFILPNNPVDYDKFDEVFSVAADLLKKYEHRPEGRTLIHISPGTAIPAGALTALGIKKNRSILYTRQNGKDRDEVSSIDIDVDSMNDWIGELMEEKDDREK